MAERSAVSVVLGTGCFGYRDGSGIGVTGDKAVVQSLIDLFKSHGHNEIDNARVYGDGTSETVLADIEWQKQGLILDTKIRSNPAGAHTPEKIAESVEESLRELKTNKVHILYLHAPDRSVPLETVLAAVNEEYKKGRFEEFGLSNYSPEEVEQIVKITQEKGYVRPSVYQGLYNLLVRGGEEKFFPLLRQHGIRFFAYSPLAGSFLVDSIPNYEPNSQTRFDPNTRIGKLYGDKFVKESHVKAHELLRNAAHQHGLTVSEVALRWLTHHSQLKREHGDAIIIGGKTYSRLKDVLVDLDKPALPEEILKVVNEAWQLIKDDAANFHI